MMDTLQSDEELLAEINKQFQKYLSNPENIQSSAVTLLEDLIDDAIMSVIFEVDIERKTGLRDLILGEPEDEKFRIVETQDLDIFGQTPGKKSHECICPSCKRSLAASRFAPHLEKCMGMGRNSSRIASRRIANNANKEIYSSGLASDDDDDADWTAGADKKGKKRKDRVQMKKLSKSSKPNKNGNTDPSDTTMSNISLENLNETDRRNLLSQICGVMSEHTKKLCTRSTKCPQHTDEQKKALRDFFAPDHNDLALSDNLQVDVDTYEEGDSQSMRECLGRSWEAEHSNTSSPADSASTSSSSSKKRDKSSVKFKNKNFSSGNKNHKNLSSLHEAD